MKIVFCCARPRASTDISCQIELNLSRRQKIEVEKKIFVRCCAYTAIIKFLISKFSRTIRTILTIRKIWPITKKKKKKRVLFVFEKKYNTLQKSERFIVTWVFKVRWFLFLLFSCLVLRSLLYIIIIRRRRKKVLFENFCVWVLVKSINIKSSNLTKVLTHTTKIFELYCNKTCFKHLLQ